MLPGLSQQQARALRRRGLATRADVARYARARGMDDPVIAGLPLPALADIVYDPVPRIPYAAAARLGELVRRHTKISGGPYIGPQRIWVVGSTRRRGGAAPGATKDLDVLVVLPPEHRDRGDRLARLRMRSPLALRHSYASGPRRRSCVVGHGGQNYRVDVFMAYDDELPYALYHHTGSRQYNIRLRARAKSRGWRLNQYGLFDAGTDARVPGSARIRTEDELARFIGATPRPPAARG